MKKDFESRFMPSAKFSIMGENRDLLLSIGIPIMCNYVRTSFNGDIVALCDCKTNFEKWEDSKEVSIYEAIPELIPDGMRYNKELHKLVPDVVGDLSNDIIYLVDEFQKNKDFKTKTYGDIKKEVLQRENIDIKEDDKQILDELKKSGKSYLEIIYIIKNTDTFTPSYYGAKCKCGEKLDAYAICDKYSNEHKTSAWHHAVKKLLRAGDGHKPLIKDIDEVIDSLKRWKEQLNAK